MITHNQAADEPERQRFEAWAKTQGLPHTRWWLERLDDGSYHTDLARVSWNAWKARAESADTPEVAQPDPDCWVVVKNGKIVATHDEPCHLNGTEAVRYVPAVKFTTAQLAQPITEFPHQQTLDAILAAVRIEGGLLRVSIQGFQESWNSNLRKSATYTAQARL